MSNFCSTARKDANKRSHILTKLEQDQKITLQAMAEECQRIITLRHDMNKTEEKDCSQIHSCRPEMDKKKEKRMSSPNLRLI